MSPVGTLIEAGPPADDGRAFRRCLGQFATGVTVMTTQHGDSRAGMSVNSFAALSLDPALVLWSIRRESASLPLFRAAGHFAVNVLAADQVELSNRFARAGDDKFAGVVCRPGRLGAPLIEGAIATLECRLHEVHEGGDHFILVGQVEHYARYGGEPLLFAQGRYAVPQEHPDLVEATAPAPAAEAAQEASEGSLLRLLHYGSNLMSARFDEHREAEGLTVAQLRIYGWLRTRPRTLEDLRQRAYLGGRDADDTVADLIERGHVHRDAAGCLSLTAAGRERAEASARRVAAFEAGWLQGIAPADIATARRVLGALVRHGAVA